MNTRRTERSRKSTGGLIIEPSNAVHTTPTQDGPSHPPPPTHRTLLCHLGTHPDRSPRWPTSERGSFRFEGKCRANGGWRRCESRVRVRKHERQRVRAPCFHRDLHVQITHTNLHLPPHPTHFVPASRRPYSTARRDIGVWFRRRHMLVRRQQSRVGSTYVGAPEVWVELNSSPTPQQGRGGAVIAFVTAAAT